MKAYLIGNGASIPYGSPLGAEVFKKALELFYNGWQYYHDNRYYRLKDYLTVIIRRMDDLRNQVACGRLDSLHMGEFSQKFEILINPEISNVEKRQIYREIEIYLSNYRIWELFPEIIKYYNDDELHGFRDSKEKRVALIEGRDNFFDKIGDFSFKTIYFAIKHSKCEPDYYFNFVKAIDDSLEDTIIINLNYDNLFEKAIETNFNGLVEYGIGDKIQCFPSSQFGKNTGQKILLFKPHGSFNLLFCEKCKSITISQDIPLEYFQDIAGKRQYRNPNCGKRNLQNFFIPYTDVSLPIRYKDILDSFIARLKHILAGVEEIIVIGYSFSEYNGDLIDKHLKFIFENRKIVVVAKNTSESEKICTRLKKLSIAAESSGFNGFADFVRHMCNPI